MWLNVLPAPVMYNALYSNSFIVSMHFIDILQSVLSVSGGVSLNHTCPRCLCPVVSLCVVISFNYIPMSPCTHVCSHLSVYSCIYVRLSVCLSLSVYVRVYVHACVTLTWLSTLNTIVYLTLTFDSSVLFLFHHRSQQCMMVKLCYIWRKFFHSISVCVIFQPHPRFLEKTSVK